MDAHAIWQCATEIPEEWYEGDREGLNRLLEALHHRRGAIQKLITEFRRSSRNPFPNWRESPTDSALPLDRSFETQRFVVATRASNGLWVQSTQERRIRLMVEHNPPPSADSAWLPVIPLPIALYVSGELIFELYDGGQPRRRFSIRWERLVPAKENKPETVPQASPTSLRTYQD
jgi:hypothetical protein